MAKIAALLPLLLLAVGCGKTPAQKLTALAEEYVYGSLAFSPSTATAAGLHQHRDQQLDEMLDDFSAQSLSKQQTFYEKIRDRLADLKAGELTPEDRADLTILQDQIALSLLDFNEIHSPLHSPQLYVETLGNALFAPYVLEYAPKPDRIRHIIARLQKVPLYLDQAATNLVSAPGVWTQVAIEENQGNMNLVDKEIRAGLPPDQAETYARAARPALDAMTRFDKFLRNSLSSRNSHDWRLGGSIYPRKFRYALETGVEADNTLQQAERDLLAVRARMLQLALPLHREAFAAHKDHSDLDGAGRENTVIGEVLGKIADRHATRESFMDDARKALDEARAFVQEKHLLMLPPRANLQVIPTPEFMRGSYPVGGFNAAPALEPQLGAFYWVTPIPPSWPKERVDSKLREYNFYKLKLLTIHEAMPGHYVQMEIANDVQPKSRRILRSIFGNGPYIEGWGQYSTQVMLDEGFLNRAPELALTFAKEELRVLANAIIDIRLQMLGMTDQEALDLMQKQTFQEVEEATAKLQRAKLTAAQLPMYYVGWRAWIKARDEFKQAKGSAYSLADFNDRALKEGAVPVPALSSLLK
ncbi:MAG: DUF885 domain-containing protein [Candidatus Solibacter sp.]|nr:DUF885 domain-containing protein [Candidatus Solibacter sp.]